jgi:hypothetical protein
MTARAKHDITLEFMRMGALKGIVIDGAGVTVFNYYTEFGITAEGDRLRVHERGSTCATVHERRALDRRQPARRRLHGVRALVSPEWFDAFVAHANVKAPSRTTPTPRSAWAATCARASPSAASRSRNTAATRPTPRARTRSSSPANEGHAFPMGTRQTFRTFVAPADFNETVGTIGQLYYAKIEPRKFNRGYDAHTQSNPLPMCMRPAGPGEAHEVLIFMGVRWPTARKATCRSATGTRN